MVHKNYENQVGLGGKYENLISDGETRVIIIEIIYDFLLTIYF